MQEDADAGDKDADADAFDGGFEALGELVAAFDSGIGSLHDLPPALILDVLRHAEAIDGLDRPSADRTASIPMAPVADFRGFLAGRPSRWPMGQPPGLPLGMPTGKPSLREQEMFLLSAECGGTAPLCTHHRQLVTPTQKITFAASRKSVVCGCPRARGKGGISLLKTPSSSVRTLHAGCSCAHVLRGVLAHILCLYCRQAPTWKAQAIDATQLIFILAACTGWDTSPNIDIF